MILKKCNPKDLQNFEWLNFEYLPDSRGFKFEIDFEESYDLVSKSIDYFHFLFKKYFNEIIVSPPTPNFEWGSFCLEVWNGTDDTYDYSNKNKHAITINYLNMLKNNNIEVDYIGCCRCLNWNEFLVITLNCIINYMALYSMMFYIPSENIVFYFHYSGSIGVYYQELNAEVINILEKIKISKAELKNSNDERISSFI